MDHNARTEPHRNFPNVHMYPTYVTCVFVCYVFGRVHLRNGEYVYAVHDETPFDQMGDFVREMDSRFYNIATDDGELA